MPAADMPVDMRHPVYKQMHHIISVSLKAETPDWNTSGSEADSLSEKRLSEYRDRRVC